ncbi:NTF2-like protein [Gracilaria domingensis]|nr:NTF2-like protein [Gracilaria domingensis]
MAFCTPCNLGLTWSGFPLPTFRTSFGPSYPKTFAAPLQRSIRAELIAGPPTGPSAAAKSEQLIRRYWSLAANGKYSTTIACFADDAVYHDGLYPKPFTGRENILAHFTNLEGALPPSLLFALDDVTASAERVAARWHVETTDGTRLPLSRGLSMYNLVEQNGELFIAEAWEYGETSLKLPSIVLPLLRFLAWLLQLRDVARSNSDG